MFYFQVLESRLEFPLFCQPGIKAKHRGLSELPSARLQFILRQYDVALMSLSCKHIEVNAVASPMPGGVHYYNYSEGEYPKALAEVGIPGQKLRPLAGGSDVGDAAIRIGSSPGLS